MRLNQYLAAHTELSRRAADREIENGRVKVNNRVATLGDTVEENDTVFYNGQQIKSYTERATILFHKPAGYVCSKKGQGSRTIYDILPDKYHKLNPVGRLDKDSSGLLVLTNDGELANRLAHPRYSKMKKYLIELDKTLQPLHQQMINDFGIQLEDGPSKLQLHKQDNQGMKFEVNMSEGRNRQIRRTFFALGYKVTKLHRIKFGDYDLGELKPGETKIIV